MKKSIWIFLLAVLLPGFVLGWLALRSAEEQQIIFERRTAELYQKETESLAARAREIVETERRTFGDTVHRLLARSDPPALARDFTNSLTDAWPRKAVGFVLGPEGQMLSPTTAMAAKNGEWRQFLWDNGSFLCSTQPAVVYPVPVDMGNTRFAYNQTQKARATQVVEGKPALAVGKGGETTILAQKGIAQQQQQEQAPQLFLKQMVPPQEAERAEGGSQRSQKIQPGVAGRALTSGGAQAASAPTVQTPQAPAMVNDPADRTRDLSREQIKREAAKGEPEQLSREPSAGQQTKVLNPEPAVRPTRGVSMPPPAPATAMPAVPAAPAPSLADPAGAPAPAPSLKPKRAAPIAPDTRASSPRGLVMPPPETAAATQPTSPAKESPTKAVEDAVDRPAVTRQQAEPMREQAELKLADPPAAEEKQKKLSLAAAPAVEALGVERGRKLAEETRKEFDDAKAATGAVGGVVGGSPQQRSVQADQNLRAPDAYAPAPNTSAEQSFGGVSEGNLVSNSQTAVQNQVLLRSNTDLFNRMVEPQQQTRSAAANWSAILPATADFRALTANNEEGMLARFVQDKLDLIFWLRPPEAPEMVFGCLIEAADLGELWKELFANYVSEERSERPAYVLALLDDKARPVTTFPKMDNGREWKRPFVASEIGEVLPHWEAALYLATPTAMADTARGLRRTLSFTIAAAIALIAIGGWLVVADVRRQLALAQQKTDFVSNVSHELKTPLTSIRMFAELMHDRPPPAEKQGQYLRIITVEAERLTRLINNVLDFAKLERRQKRFDKKPLDLCGVITRVWEGHEMHLRDAGFQTRWQAAPGPYPVLGDEDALAQILVNLLSNAEKYSQERKDVELVTWIENGCINISILDRGMGVPDGEERKIFEAFYRAHDSLSSGIQGSGLGLTLAQRLAREHGGEIVFERRKDGGSRFTLRMPMVNGHDADPSSPGDGAGPTRAA
jgi:signal transduction histidine kinase